MRTKAKWGTTLILPEVRREGWKLKWNRKKMRHERQSFWVNEFSKSLHVSREPSNWKQDSRSVSGDYSIWFQDLCGSRILDLKICFWSVFTQRWIPFFCICTHFSCTYKLYLFNLKSCICLPLSSKYMNLWPQKWISNILGHSPC